MDPWTASQLSMTKDGEVPLGFYAISHKGSPSGANATTPEGSQT
jgi:hypothetical protein